MNKAQIILLKLNESTRSFIPLLRELVNQVKGSKVTRAILTQVATSQGYEVDDNLLNVMKIAGFEVI